MHRSTHIEYTPIRSEEFHDFQSTDPQWDHQLKTLRQLQRKVERLISESNSSIQQNKTIDSPMIFNSSSKSTGNLTSRSTALPNEQIISSIEYNIRHSQQMISNSNEILKHLQSTQLVTSQLAHITRFKTIFSGLSQEIQRQLRELSALKQRSIIIPMNNLPTEEQQTLMEERQSTFSAITSVNNLLEQGSQNLHALNQQNKRLGNTSSKLNKLLTLSKDVGTIFKKITWFKNRNTIITFCTILFLSLFSLWWAFR